MRSALVRVGVVLVLAVGGLAACGGDDDGDDGGAGGASTTQATTASVPDRPDALVGQAHLGTELHTVVFGAGSVWVSDHNNNLVLRLDPETLDVVGEIATGNNPAVMRITDDALWVGNYGTSAATSDIVRVDPSSGEVVARIKPPDLCCELGLGTDALWTSSPDGIQSRIDTETNAIVATADIGEFAVGGIVVTPDAVWVAGEDILHRIDPATNQVVDTVDVQGFLVGESGGRVWGVDGTDLWSIDPETNDLAETYDLSDSVNGLGEWGVVDDGILYVKAAVGFSPTSILAIDLATGEALGAVDLELAPGRLSVGGGFVWTASESGTLVKVDQAALTEG